MSDLYHNRVLELAANIPNVGKLVDAHGSCTKRSLLCGSQVRVDVRLCVDDGDTVAAIAVEPKACALGQAATAILSGNAIGTTCAALQEARNQLYAMLKQGEAPPRGRFWELRHLEAVRDYPPRHDSVLLAFEAILAATQAGKGKLAHPGVETLT